MIGNEYEIDSWSNGRLLLGCDESGYGCISGSMFVAGVVFPPHFNFTALQQLNDSKVLSENRRFVLEQDILKSALHYFCKEVTVAEIDAGSPYHLRFEAAREMAMKIDILATLDVLMDGNVTLQLPQAFSSKALIKGDGKCFTIAAASIIAKCAKDRQMRALDKEFPVYGWASNKGYESAAHKSAILKYGLSPHHRRTYCKKYNGVICT
jgi:ribonuclease HII